MMRLVEYFTSRIHKPDVDIEEEWRDWQVKRNSSYICVNVYRSYSGAEAHAMGMCVYDMWELGRNIYNTSDPASIPILNYKLVDKYLS